MALPVLIFSIPAIAGHMLISDDNLVQNYPLRILVGRYLRDGHLPLWNPYIWSGTPLLAGFNAGVAYPASWLFVVLPPRVAFVCDEILVFAVAATGLYAFLRLHALSRPVAALGGATFAFGGFVSSQLIHIDLVEAASLLPWCLVALRRFATRPEGDRGYRWVVMLAGVLGLLILAGAPEALINGAVVIVIYALSLALRYPRHRVSIVFALVSGLLGAVVVGAAQLVPGLVFQGQSQRAASSFIFYANGSLPPRLGVLTLVPYLLGGYGRLGVPIYFGPFNLAELSSYMGILPVIAAFSLLVPLLRRERAEWRVWYLVLVVGAVLAFGSYTPLGHLIADLPLLGSVRLQSRNLLAVDLSLAILFAFWLERMLSRPRRPGVAERVAISLPVAGVVVIYVLFLTWGPQFARSLGAVVPSSLPLHRMIPYMTLALAIAVAAGYIASFRHVVAPRHLLPAITLLTVADLGLFTVYQSWLAPAPSTAVSAVDSRGNALADVTGDQRFAVYNPELYNYPELLALGEPDLNILRHLSSVQGYGSLVSGQYHAATGTHDQASLFPQILSGSTPDELNLGVLVSRPPYFVTQLSPQAASLTHPPPSVVSNVGVPPPAPPPPPIGHGQQRTWYFGAPLVVVSVTIPAPSPTASGILAPEESKLPSPPVRVGLLTSSGVVSWPASQSTLRTAQGTDGATGPRLTTTFDRPVAGTGLVVEDLGPTPLTVGVPRISTWDQGDMLLNGPLQDEVKPPRWRFDGNIDQSQFGVFVNSDRKASYWLQPPGATAVRIAPPPAGTSVRRLSEGDNGSETYQVDSSTPVSLVRSVAYAPGWSASVRSGAQTRQYPIGEVGLVQAVNLPSGSHEVAFTYAPLSALAGVTVSLVSWLGLLAAGVAWGFRRRRARKRNVPCPTPQVPQPGSARDSK